MDGPSSFAALYGSFVRVYGETRDPGEIFDQLIQLRNENLVKAWQMDEDGSFSATTESDFRRARDGYRSWLPKASFDELSIDEIGIWFEITEVGLQSWRDNSDRAF